MSVDPQTNPIKLTDRQREVAQLACDGLKQNQIAERLNIAPGTVKTHLNGMWQAFGVENVDRLGDEERSRLLREVVQPYLDGVNPPIIEQTPPKPQSEPPKSSREPEPQPPVVMHPDPANRLRSLVFLVVGLAVGMGLLFALLAVAGALRNPFAGSEIVAAGPTPTPIVQTRVVEQLVPVTQTVVVKETELVPQTVVVKETSVVTVPQVITVTQVVTVTEALAITEPLLGDTPQPAPTENGSRAGDQLQTAIPGAESTPELPAPTGTPDGYGLTLPFADDFADSFQPDWRVISGRRVIQDQRLTSSTPELVMELGTDQLKNYTVSFDWSGPGINVVFGKLRYRDEPWAGYTRRCFWEEWRDSSWQVLREMPRCIGENGNVTFTLEDTRFSVKSKGTEISNMVVEGIETRGPFRLTLSREIAIDSFRLTVP